MNTENFPVGERVVLTQDVGRYERGQQGIVVQVVGSLIGVKADGQEGRVQQVDFNANELMTVERYAAAIRSSWHRWLNRATDAQMLRLDKALQKSLGAADEPPDVTYSA